MCCELEISSLTLILLILVFAIQSTKGYCPRVFATCKCIFDQLDVGDKMTTDMSSKRASLHIIAEATGNL